MILSSHEEHMDVLSWKMDFDMVCIASTEISISAFIHLNRLLTDANFIKLWWMTTHDQKWQTSKKGRLFSFFS